MTKQILPVACLVLCASVLCALTEPTSEQSSKAVKVLDPNQVICEYEEELGSRLGGHKVCATRAEWQARRNQDRMQIEKSQLNRGSAGAQ